eukprot:Tamp_07925.p2 GENE.Tamp_07925~~Tamp_07925.p2  ORF type:complete len:139 (-),score=14.95 Tamp_07925:829-1245(-)
MTCGNGVLASAVMRPSSGSKIFQVPLTRDRIALNVSEPEGMRLQKDSKKPMQRAVLLPQKPAPKINRSAPVGGPAGKKNSGGMPQKPSKKNSARPMPDPPGKPVLDRQTFLIAVFACKSSATRRIARDDERLVDWATM